MFCYYYGWCEYKTLYCCRLSIAIIKTEKKAEQNIRSGAVPHYVSYEITCSLPQHGEGHCTCVFIMSYAYRRCVSLERTKTPRIAEMMDSNNICFLSGSHPQARWTVWHRYRCFYHTHAHTHLTSSTVPYLVHSANFADPRDFFASSGIFIRCVCI